MGMKSEISDLKCRWVRRLCVAVRALASLETCVMQVCVFQCVAVCCSVLQCVEVCCSGFQIILRRRVSVPTLRGGAVGGAVQDGYTYVNMCIHIHTQYIHIYMCIYMYIYICLNIYISVYTYMYINIHVFIYVFVRVYVYMYVYMCSCICICLYTYTYMYIYTYLSIYAYIYTCIHIYTYMYICIYIHIFNHIRTHTHTHTHIHTSVRIYLMSALWTAWHECTWRGFEFTFLNKTQKHHSQVRYFVSVTLCIFLSPHLHPEAMLSPSARDVYLWKDTGTFYYLYMKNMGAFCQIYLYMKKHGQRKDMGVSLCRHQIVQCCAEPYSRRLRVRVNVCVFKCVSALAHASAHSVCVRARHCVYRSVSKFHASIHNIHPS